MDYLNYSKEELINEIKNLQTRLDKYEIDYQNRIKAKEMLKKKSDEGNYIKNIKNDEIPKLIEELNIHQIELELQNDELLKTNEHIAFERELYLDLYNQAPIPYLTLNRNGNIIKLNKYASDMLGIDAHKLNFNSFFPYVHEDSKFKFSLHFKNVLDKNDTEWTEIKILNSKGEVLHCQLQTVSYYDYNYKDKLCRLTVTDITRQKQELIDSQKKFEVFFKSINDAIFIHPFGDSPDATFTDFNQTAMERYGYTKDELLKMTPFDITDSTSVTKEKAVEIHKNIREHKSYRFNAVHITKKGRRIPVDISSNVIHFGNSEYILSIARDISDAAKATASIEQLNQRIESSMLAGNMAWWEMELPSGKTVFNTNKTKLIGRDSDDFNTYHDFMKYLHPDDYEPSMQAMRDHISGNKKYYDIEYRIQHKDGYYKWFYDIGKLLSSEDGIMKFSGIILDITDKKNAEIALENERRQFMSILNSIPEEIYVADKDTHEIIFANNSIKENHDPEPIGKKCYEVIEGSEEPCEYCVNNDSISEKPTYREFYNLKNKKHYYIIERLFQWAEHENLKFQMSIDITKRKLAELKLQEINDSKDKLFAMIAHDLRSPFTGFLGLSELLSSESDTISKDELKRISSNLHKSAVATFNLINDLLLWARSQSGSIPLHQEKLDIYELVYNNIYLLSKTAELKNINIETTCKKGLDAFVDRNMIMTVIRNLLDNAIKFSKPDSKIILKCEDNNDNYTIMIQDFGAGIDKERQDKLFKLGQQSSTRGTSGEKGTGLGLNICKEFVEKNNGNIWVESEPGKGSTFFFTVPK
jgi:PAS domain S-box-containing protein